MLSYIIFQNETVKSKNKIFSHILFLLANFNTNFALLRTVFLSMITACQKHPGQELIQNKNSPLQLLPFPPLGITWMLKIIAAFPAEILLSASCEVTFVMMDCLLNDNWCSTVHVMQYKCTCFWWSYITYGIIPY